MAREPIAVIPVAGVGTRLRPHTHTQPKVLLHVAGKPMLAHILDDLPSLGIQEAVLIVGYLGDRVQDYVRRAYPQLKVHFVDQPERLGLGHAVSLAQPYAVGRPVLVILGDTIFEADLKSVMASRVNRIGVKAVEDPRRFGIVGWSMGAFVAMAAAAQAPDRIQRLALVDALGEVDRGLAAAPAIVPIQLLAWRLAVDRGYRPGTYTRASKITTRE